MKVFFKRPGAGFTLIEILVAIGIFSLVVAAIYTCWSAILRSSKVGLDAAARTQRSRMALQSIEESLTYARMYAANAERYYWFEGNSGSDAWLSFVAQLPRSFPRGGKFGDLTMRRVEFSLQEGPDYTRQLVLRQRPLLMDYDEDEENHPLVLAREVEEMIVNFWDQQQEDWIDEWTLTNEIPPLVRVSLITKRGTGYNARKVESTLVIRPASMAVQAANQGAVPPTVPPGTPAVPTPQPRRRP
jgi:type II secretion system protein J